MTPYLSSYTTHILGEDQPGVEGLPAMRVETVEGYPAWLSIWQPSPEEIAEIANGGPVFLLVIGNTHPAVMLSAETASINLKEPSNEPPPAL